MECSPVPFDGIKCPISFTHSNVVAIEIRHLLKAEEIAADKEYRTEQGL